MASPSPPESVRLGGMAALLLAIGGLSLGSTMVKSAHLPGPVMGWWRLLIGAIIWQAIVRFRRTPLTRAQWKATFIPGVLFGINLLCFFTGVTKTRVANAEFLGTLTPLFIVPIAAVRLKERVPRAVIALGVVALGGVALIVLLSGKGGRHSVTGDLFIVGAMITWSSYLLVSRNVRMGMDVPAFMTGMTTFAALTILPFAFGTHRLGQMTGHALVLVVLSGVTSGVLAHGLLSHAQRSLPLSTIVLVQLVQPALGATWAWVFLGESIRPVQMLGMAVVLCAVGSIARISSGGRP